MAMQTQSDLIVKKFNTVGKSVLNLNHSKIFIHYD